MCGTLSPPSARQHAEARRIAFGAALEQHLQAEADAQIGLVAQRLEHGVARAACREAPHAIGQRALPRNHHPVRGADERGIGRHQHLGFGRDVLERLGNRAQVAHSVVHHSDAHCSYRLE